SSPSSSRTAPIRACPPSPCSAPANRAAPAGHTTNSPSEPPEEARGGASHALQHQLQLPLVRILQRDGQPAGLEPHLAVEAVRPRVLLVHEQPHPLNPVRPRPVQRRVEQHLGQPAPA